MPSSLLIECRRVRASPIRIPAPGRRSDFTDRARPGPGAPRRRAWSPGTGTRRRGGPTPWRSIRYVTPPRDQAERLRHAISGPERAVGVAQEQVREPVPGGEGPVRFARVGADRRSPLGPGLAEGLVLVAERAGLGRAAGRVVLRVEEEDHVRPAPGSPTGSPPDRPPHRCGSPGRCPPRARPLLPMPPPSPIDPPLDSRAPARRPRIVGVIVGRREEGTRADSGRAGG